MNMVHRFDNYTCVKCEKDTGHFNIKHPPERWVKFCDGWYCPDCTPERIIKYVEAVEKDNIETSGARDF